MLGKRKINIHIDMKKIFLSIIALFSISLLAQEEEIDMSKYLVGAIIEKDGKVYFERSIKAPTLSSNHIYKTAYLWLEDHLDDEGVKNPQIFESDDPSNAWMASMPEHFLVFKKTMISVDRTFIKYRIRLTASDENLKMELWDITYEYYPGAAKEPERYPAEKCITDEYALDKTKTKLNRLTSKFRIKTIDMVDEYTKELELLLNAEIAKLADALNRADKTDLPRKISYERHTPTSMSSTTPAPAAKQPTMAELQAQMAAQKKAAATTPAPTAPVEKVTAPVEVAPAVSPAPLKEEKPSEAPVPVEKPSPVVAPVVASSSATLPADLVNLIKEDGIVVSAAGRVANAQWGGVAYLNDKMVITLFVPKSRPAHTMLSSDDKFTITVGGIKYHVIECSKMSSSDVAGNMTMFIGEVIKVESR